MLGCLFSIKKHAFGRLARREPVWRLNLINTRHPFDVLQHGVRLNRIASQRLGDVNAARFAVHSVLTEAMRGNISPVTLAGLEAALTHTLATQARTHTQERPLRGAQAI